MRQDKLVYVRDFAYPHRTSARRIMADNIGDAPAKAFAELLSGPVVDIYVGIEKRRWMLHRNMLCHHSEYFSSQLLPADGKKDQDKSKLELLEDDPAGFELFVKWLYQGKIEDVSEITDDHKKYEYAVACHKLYNLCELFSMPQLKNIAMDQYRKGLNQTRLVPDAEEICDIYKASPEGSSFRRLMTKIAARQIMDPENDNDVENYRPCFENNPTFAIDLVNQIKWSTGGTLFDDPTSGDECDYHDHSDGPNCHIKAKARKAMSSKAARSNLSISTSTTASTANTNGTSSSASMAPQKRQNPNQRQNQFPPKINGVERQRTNGPKNNGINGVNGSYDSGGESTSGSSSSGGEGRKVRFNRGANISPRRKRPPKIQREGVNGTSP